MDRNPLQLKRRQEFVIGLFFSMFEYNIKFRCTSDHGNADALSRLPLSDTVEENDVPPELVLLVEHLDSSPVTASQIKQSTMCDPELAMVFEYVQHGWPGKSAVSSSLNPFYQRKEELSVLNGCLLWGARVVIPKSYRAHVLTQLHEGHPGVTKMKGLSRMYVWWPGISKDIEDMVSDCTECQQHQSTPQVAPLHP